jgi:hypothetical protein
VGAEQAATAVLHQLIPQEQAGLVSNRRYWGILCLLELVVPEALLVVALARLAVMAAADRLV